MPNTQTTVGLDGVHRTLVDINESVSSFDALVVISPPSESDEYQVAIVSQDELDSGDDILVRNVKGQFKTSKSSRSNTFQNFYVYLSSSSPISNIVVDVDLNQVHIQDDTIVEAYKPSESAVDSTTLRILVGIIVLVIGCVLLKHFWNQRT